MTNSLFASILASAHIDPMMYKLVLMGSVLLAVGFVLKLVKQPYIIGYILTGVLFGPSGFEVIADQSLIASLGELGLVLLLFFIGMEISLADLIANWKVPVLGTLFQIILSVVLVWLIGIAFGWSVNRVIMLGFVISLSSTAVVIKLLQERNETNTIAGQNAIAILIAQDIIIVPMLIVLTYLSGATAEPMDVIKQIGGGLLIIGLVALVLKRKHLRMPLGNYLKEDHELQVFVAFVLCFGLAVLTGFLALSPALGAFVAGILVASTRATEWVHENLHSFRVVFVALFFVSIGMLIDLEFFKQNLLLVIGFALMVFVINTVINASVMRIFKFPIRESIYTGAILSQIGEFSFILGSTGYAAGIITEYGYNLIVSIIAVTLMLSPFWILLVRKLAKPSNAQIAHGTV